MSSMNFIRGMAIGLAAGMAVGALIAPRKKPVCKHLAGKVIKAIGDAVDSAAGVFGL